MSAKVEQHCTLLVSHNDAKGALPSVQEIEEQLQSSSVTSKAEALKALIHMIMTGEEQTRLLMTVIRYCLNTDDHKVQKLLQLYWEVVEKYNPEGGLREEMILVCNALLKNLQHANEFLRGCTLRFLCRLKEPELVGPLVPTIEENLKHRHPYVRKNAAAAVHILYTTFGEGLVPDAVEAMHRFLLEEEDAAAMRNAFLMLATHKPDLALGFVADNIDRVPSLGVGMQQQVLELIRRECRHDAQRRATYGKVLFALLSSSSPAVTFEAAGALVILSSAPLAVSKAASAYTQLLSTHADTNVKLVVLERLAALRKLHPRVLEESLMDVARSLQNPNLDIRQKTLDIVLQLVSARSAETLVSLLRKEVLATQDGSAGQGDEDAAKYRGMLIRAIHRCALRFPAVSGRVVLLLLDFVHAEGALEVMTYVREVAQTQPALLPAVLEKLVQNLGSMTDAPAMRVALWVLGEFSAGAAVRPAVDAVLDALGARDGQRLRMDADSVAKLSLTNGDVAPRATDEREGGREATLASGAGVPGGGRRPGPRSGAAAAPGPAGSVRTASSGPATLADGTYASQAAVVAEPDGATGVDALGGGGDGTALRWHVLHGNFFLAAVCASTLTKLALRARREEGSERVRDLSIEVMMVLCDLAELGVADTPRFAPDADTQEHVKRCLCLLLDTCPDQKAEADLLSEPGKAWGAAMSSVASPGARVAAEAEEAKAKEAAAEPRTGADTLVSFRQLRSGLTSTGTVDAAMDDAGDLTRATGAGAEGAEVPRRVQQLTGPGDSVYVEAEVTVHDFDILLRISVRNQTAETLSNCSLDLFTQGDMKLVERTQPFTLAAEGTHVVSLSVKVSSTEKGCVFGSIQFDHSSRAESTVLQLDAVALDLMDYMRPASCDEFAFRTMWAKFEWENKLPVNTLIPSMHDFLNHITTITRMRCLTPAAALEGEADFLSANLYATTVFGEHALLNISLERHPTSRRIVGFVRIRSKAQGIALKLGDIVTANQQRPLPGSPARPSDKKASA